MVCNLMGRGDSPKLQSRVLGPEAATEKRRGASLKGPFNGLLSRVLSEALPLIKNSEVGRKCVLNR